MDRISLFHSPSLHRAATTASIICIMAAHLGASLYYFQEFPAVTTPSGTRQSVPTASGIVSVISAQDIEHSGAQTLAELLERSCGTFLLSSSLYTQGTLTVRGNASTAQNNTVLYLINGQPVSESILNGMSTPFLYTFPLTVIERIEIVRGAAPLYGSGASDAVINIITHDKLTKTAFEFSYGSSNSQRFTLSLPASLLSLSCVGGVTGATQDGWQYTATDENGFSHSQLFARQEWGTYFSAIAGGFRFQSSIGSLLSDHLGILPVWPVDQLSITQSQLSANYDYEIDEDRSVLIGITNNYSSQSYPVDPSPVANEHPMMDCFSQDTALTLGYRFAPSEYTHIMAQASYEQQTGELPLNGLSTIPAYVEPLTSAAVSIKFGLFPPLSLYTHARWAQPQGGNAVVAPEAGILIPISKALVIRASNATGFRLPSAAEKYIESATLAGNPLLESETTVTSQVEIVLQTRRVRISAAALSSAYSNLIISTPTVIATKDTYTNNPDAISATGYETECIIVPSNRFLISASLSAYTFTDADGETNISPIPASIAKIGCTYTPNNGFYATIFDSYASAPIENTAHNPAMILVNPSPASSHYLTIHLAFDFIKLFNLTGPAPVRFKLTGINILNNGVSYAPEFTRSAINTLPAGPGASYYMTLSFDF